MIPDDKTDGLDQTRYLVFEVQGADFQAPTYQPVSVPAGAVNHPVLSQDGRFYLPIAAGNLIVLDPDRDADARVALTTYVLSCAQLRPQLSRDVLALLARTSKHFSIHQSALLNLAVEGVPGEAQGK